MQSCRMGFPAQVERRDPPMNRQKRTTSRLIPVLCALLAVLLGTTLFVLLRPEQEPPQFTPPPFDATAEQGVPTVPEELGYSSPFKDGMSYRFSICGNVVVDDGKAVVYLTNPAENAVWLKVRLLAADGTLLGETGLIRPGEYVRAVDLTTVPASDSQIQLKIMGYEPETYRSAGSVTLNTMIGTLP